MRIGDQAWLEYRRQAEREKAREKTKLLARLTSAWKRIVEFATILIQLIFEQINWQIIRSTFPVVTIGTICILLGGFSWIVITQLH